MAWGGVGSTTREASLGCSVLLLVTAGVRVEVKPTHHNTGLRRAGAALSHRRSGACSLSRSTDGIAFLRRRPWPHGHQLLRHAPAAAPAAAAPAAAAPAVPAAAAAAPAAAAAAAAAAP
eukprot:scaffold116122_cov69-Phaeocystis_antarctica.AAC.1